MPAALVLKQIPKIFIKVGIFNMFFHELPPWCVLMLFGLSDPFYPNFLKNRLLHTL